ncbi:large terminase subunit [Delftia phage RG-2014]|uniref:Large terminase subunit n=1 Tax=Delftia phage RG-2014 TaxID=1563661 RepID=A0A097PAS3_9CAUD|nr:large terminase subunit [Delftia phage RG-2014]AIU44340.1 large terminase subunit [Delftia phage RG-2014]
MSEPRKLVKKTLDQWLDDVDYAYLNGPEYMPSAFSLTFMNWIKLVEGNSTQNNLTPPVHLAMLDKISAGVSKFIANLCFRGAAKTTLMFEYLALFVAHFGVLPNLGKVSGMIYVSDTMENGVKSARKNIETRYNNSPFLQYWIPEAKFTDAYLEFTNRDGHKLGIRMYGAKTGIRGTKIFGLRPQLAVLDDLISDDDSKSPTAMQTIKDTIYDGVFPALHPSKFMVLFNGTPFNSEDVMIGAVESGGWDVNVWPMCAKWPCTREEFDGAWPDRFDYDAMLEKYEFMVANGKMNAFNREFMLRITSNEERVVQDAEIRWYKRQNLMENKHAFNFYITTDFATSKKTTADFTVILVWAYNSNGDWFLVDGVVEKQSFDQTLDDLFRLVQEYNTGLQEVGIEVNGQQGAFISVLQERMIRTNCFFHLASANNGGAPGIRRDGDKLRNFNLVVPLFKMGKFWFPEEIRAGKMMAIIMQQISLVTHSGIKGKDDALDGISMLGSLHPWKPAAYAPAKPTEVELWIQQKAEQGEARINSYLG